MKVDIRRILLFITLSVLGYLMIFYGILWSNTVWLYDLQGRFLGTLPMWFNTYSATLVQRPSLMWYPGWDPVYFKTIYWLTAFVVILWILQGGREKKLSSSRDSTSYVVTVWGATWRNHFHGLRPIACGKVYLVWMVVSTLIIMSVYGVGAHLNLFGDALLNTPFFPWHFVAHSGLAFVLMNIMNPLDIEETFRCRYRWKFLILMCALQLLSFYLEYVENLIVLQSGLSLEHYNNIYDSVFDMLAVIVGGFTSSEIYNELQFGG